MREQIEQAISLGVNGILIDHGPPEAVKDEIQKALDKGIKVVIKETSVDNPKVPQISQNDHEMARLVLEQALKDNGTSFKAGYIYVPGFNPTDLRNDIWEKVKKANPGIQEQARWGAIDFDDRSDGREPDVRGVAVASGHQRRFRAVRRVCARREDGGDGGGGRRQAQDLQHRHFDIRHPGDARGGKPVESDGRRRRLCDRRSVASRAGASGRRPGSRPCHRGEAVLITQDYLNKNDIKTLAELKAKMPELGRIDVATAPWLPEPK